MLVSPRREVINVQYALGAIDAMWFSDVFDIF